MYLYHIVWWVFSAKIATKVQEKATDTCHVSFTPGSIVAASWAIMSAGMILGFRPANERRGYKVTPSLIGWVQT